jgi:two-component system sensor histidine kinase AtoS
LGILQKVLETQEVHSAAEIMIGCGTEALLPKEAEAHPIFDKRGNFVGTFLFVEEIPVSRKLERVAAQSEKLAMVGQLAAGAVHEIKNPLTSVRGFIQLLQKEAEGSPKADYFNIIIGEIDRVNTIVDEFLKLAKPAKPNRRPSDLKELWEDIRVLVESEAFLHNINIKEDLLEYINPVLIDCEQIKQVLINVIRNSFEAMAGGGNLMVRLYGIEREKAVCFEITDTGVGMEEETVRRIFVPFFTTKHNGTGLGLAVSSTIMENHGGHMEVVSEIGKGTTTLIYFPYE